MKFLKHFFIALLITFGYAHAHDSTYSDATLENPQTSEIPKTAFLGAAIAVGVTLGRNRAKYDVPLSGQFSQKYDAAFRIDASYSIPVFSEWVFTMGATYDLGSSRYGKVSSQTNGSQSLEVSQSKRASLYLARGYRLSPNWYAYDKLSWSRVSGKYNNTDAGNSSVQHDGAGVAVGIIRAINRQFEARLELLHTVYSQAQEVVSSPTLTSTQLIFSLGYRF